MLFELDLQCRVESIVDKYLLNKQVGCIQINQEIVQIEKQTQKNLLLDQVINQFSSIIESHQDQMQKKLNLQLKTLESEISSIKEMVKKSWQDIGRTSSHSRNMSMIELELSQDSILVEDRNSIKDIIRRIKDLEENTRRKCQSTENHVNILMDLQIQLKAQLSSFMIQKSNEEIDHEKIEIKIMPNIIREIDIIVDQRLQTVQKIIQEGQNKDKDKYKFYVTIINDLTEKFESLKKDFDSTLVQKQEQKKQGVMSIFRRTPFLPF